MTTKIATLFGLIGVSLLILNSFINIVHSYQYIDMYGELFGNIIVTNIINLLGLTGILLFFIHLQSKQK